MKITQKAMGELSNDIFKFRWASAFKICLDKGINPLIIYDSLGRVNHGFQHMSLINDKLGRSISRVDNVKI